MTTFSVDLRARILAAYDAGEDTRQAVADRFLVSLGMVKKLLQQRRATGDIAPRHKNSGRKPKITTGHRERLRALVREHSDWTLKRLRDALGVDCSTVAIHNALQALDLRYKKNPQGLGTRAPRREETPCPVARRRGEG